MTFSWSLLRKQLWLTVFSPRPAKKGRVGLGEKTEIISNLS